MFVQYGRGRTRAENLVCGQRHLRSAFLAGPACCSCGIGNLSVGVLVLVLLKVPVEISRLHSFTLAGNCTANEWPSFQAQNARFRSAGRRLGAVCTMPTPGVVRRPSFWRFGLVAAGYNPMGRTASEDGKL